MTIVLHGMPHTTATLPIGRTSLTRVSAAKGWTPRRMQAPPRLGNKAVGPSFGAWLLGATLLRASRRGGGVGPDNVARNCQHYGVARRGPFSGCRHRQL